MLRLFGETSRCKRILRCGARRSHQRVAVSASSHCGSRAPTKTRLSAGGAGVFGRPPRPDRLHAAETPTSAAAADGRTRQRRPLQALGAAARPATTSPRRVPACTAAYQAPHRAGGLARSRNARVRASASTQRAPDFSPPRRRSDRSISRDRAVVATPQLSLSDRRRTRAPTSTYAPENAMSASISRASTTRRPHDASAFRVCRSTRPRRGNCREPAARRWSFPTMPTSTGSRSARASRCRSCTD